MMSDCAEGCSLSEAVLVGPCVDFAWISFRWHHGNHGPLYLLHALQECYACKYPHKVLEEVTACAVAWAAVVYTLSQADLPALQTPSVSAYI